MSNLRLKREHLKNRFLNKNRIVLFNENTFEEIFSIKLNLFNVICLSVSIFLFLIVSTIFLIVFTPLKELIPGYSSDQLKRDAIELTLKVDSLEQRSKENDAFLFSIKKTLKGETETIKLNQDSLLIVQAPLLDEKNIKASENDLKLREIVNTESKYSVFQGYKPKVNTVLFPPVKGTIIKPYDPKEERYGIEIAVVKDAPIKSVYRGTIIFAEWTLQSGYIIIIRHPEGLWSTYKNVVSLVKSQGDEVKSGEVIALGADNTESQSDSNSLYFELWEDGYSINPTMYIDFN